MRTQVLLKARHIPAFYELLIPLLLLEHLLSSEAWLCHPTAVVGGRTACPQPGNIALPLGCVAIPHLNVQHPAWVTPNGIFHLRIALFCLYFYEGFTLTQNLKIAMLKNYTYSNCKNISVHTLVCIFVKS